MLCAFAASVRTVSFRTTSRRVALFSSSTSYSKHTETKDSTKKDTTDVREGMNANSLIPPACDLDEKWDEDVSVPKSDSKESKQFPEYGNKPPGPEPTRFGDWQYKGRSTDF
jgi:hypothetical protein